jgi:Uri superfamily endonuclease
MDIVDFPKDPGSYLLHLSLAQPARLNIGRLGSFDFPAGFYFYAGSAHGPGGLRARLSHHLRPPARPHWHIDWLRAAAVMLGGWYAVGPGPLECAWSQRLASLPGCVVAAPGFGAADCRRGCSTHLLAFPALKDISIVENLLRKQSELGGMVRFVL